MGLVGSSYFLCSRKVMLSSETYQSYVSSVAPSKHAFLLPLTIRSFLERTRSLYDTLITDAGNINTSSPCETPNSVMILGGYNDSAEACAIIDFLRKSDEGNNILSGKMAASSQTRPFDDETPKIHVMSFLNENVEVYISHYLSASMLIFYLGWTAASLLCISDCTFLLFYVSAATASRADSISPNRSR